MGSLASRLAAALKPSPDTILLNLLKEILREHSKIFIKYGRGVNLLDLDFSHQRALASKLQEVSALLTSTPPERFRFPPDESGRNAFHYLAALPVIQLSPLFTGLPRGHDYPHTLLVQAIDTLKQLGKAKAREVLSQQIFLGTDSRGRGELYNFTPIHLAIRNASTGYHINRISELAKTGLALDVEAMRHGTPLSSLKQTEKDSGFVDGDLRFIEKIFYTIITAAKDEKDFWRYRDRRSGPTTYYPHSEETGAIAARGSSASEAGLLFGSLLYSDILNYTSERKKYNVFHIAAKENDVALLEKLVEVLRERGSRPNDISAAISETDEKGYTPIATAILMKKKSATLFLLNQGSNIGSLGLNTPDNILIAAIFYGQEASPEDSKTEIYEEVRGKTTLQVLLSKLSPETILPHTDFLIQKSIEFGKFSHCKTLIEYISQNTRDDSLRIATNYKDIISSRVAENDKKIAEGGSGEIDKTLDNLKKFLADFPRYFPEHSAIERVGALSKDPLDHSGEPSPSLRRGGVEVGAIAVETLFGARAGAGARAVVGAGVGVGVGFEVGARAGAGSGGGGAR